MKRKFRIIVGMLLLAIPLCMNAQVRPTKPENNKNEKVEAKKPNNGGQQEQVTTESNSGITLPKISGFVQGMYQADLSDKGELIDNTFRMRRVRLSVDGNLSKTVSYKIQGDFVRGPMLVDAYVKYKPCREFAIQVGQFKTPFSLESPINPVNLEIFDYGENVQQLVGYSDVCGIKAIGRDIGVMATGSLFPVLGEEGYMYSIVDYAVGVFNGNGVNVLDNNNRKDIVGRLEVHPGLKDLTLSGSYYYGLYKGSNDPTVLEDGMTNFGHGVRNRWSAGAQYNNGSLVIRGEYFDGKTGYQVGDSDDAGLPLIQDHRLNSNGYYGIVGYNFKAGEQKIMPVLRYEHFAKDNDINKAATNWYTVGINYWPLKSVNLKVDYSLVQKEAGANSHRVVGILSYKF
jgi:hypothetical protein